MTETRKSCDTKTRNHEIETGLVYSYVCENNINRYTDIFVITVIYGYESQLTIDQVQIVFVSSFINFYEVSKVSK